MGGRELFFCKRSDVRTASGIWCSVESAPGADEPFREYRNVDESWEIRMLRDIFHSILAGYRGNPRLAVVPKTRNFKVDGRTGGVDGVWKIQEWTRMPGLGELHISVEGPM